MVTVSCLDGSSIDKGTLPVITIEDQGGNEGGNIVMFISLSKASQAPVHFSWTTQDGGTATESVDYNLAAGQGTIEAGVLSTSIVIPTIQDADDETHETIQVKLFNISNAVIGKDQGIATIIDEDTPEISINDSSGAEGTNITFTATLNRISAKNVTFEWTTSDITTTAISDYTPLISVPAIIPAGSLTTTVDVSAIADSFDDTNNGETFNIHIGNVVNATVTDGTGLGTISDSDVPQLSINDIGVIENNIATFTISTGIASEQDITVNWSTADGTATAPADYITASGTATIPAGSLNTTVNISTFNNSAFETSETFLVNLAAPVNATILDSQGVATITDDDPAPTLSINDLSFVEGSLFSFTVTLTGSTEVNTTFDWATSNGSASTPNDYTAASATGVTILAGNTTATINVTSLEDVIDEAPQTFNVTLSNPTNATIADPLGIGTITDNDAPPNMTIDDQGVTEGGIATFTVTIDAVSEINITFDITTANNTALAGADYTANSASLTINAGLLTETFTVNTINDATPCEVGENFFVNISNAPNANITDAQGVGSITDNDPTLSINDIIVNENAGTASFTITPSVVCPGQNIDVDWATANATALTPGDYIASSGTATILAGNPNVNVTVPLNNDGISELTETFNVNLTNPINAVILDAQGVATINDDDVVPNISIDDVTITEGTNAVFTVTLSSAAGSDITVDYTTIAGTATAPNDYTTTTGTATITAGSTTQTITVPTNNDTTDEANKNFSVVISNANLGAIIDNTGVATLNDNDTVPAISINDVAIAEGGNLVFTVSLTNPSESNISFDWTTVDGTAVAPGNYTANSAVGETILAGNTTTTLTVATINNALDGNAKNLTINLSNPSNATIVDNIGIGTINDNDPTPTISIDSVAIAEGGNLVFTVTQSSASELNVTFNWATSNGSAIAPGDYTAAGAGGTITAGSTTTTINVTTIDDGNYENTETLNVTLSAPTNATIATGVGVGTINDNETPPTLSINDVSATEGGNIVFTVSLSFTADVSVSVDYSSTDGTATSPTDYPTQSNTLVIPASNPSGTITVSTVNDNLTEVAESFTINLTNPTNATIADASGTGTINDNDAIRLNTALTANRDVSTMKITPDSSMVVYLADETTDGVDELYAVNVDGTGLNKISGVLPGGGNVIDFAISNNSSKVVFIADGTSNDQFEIYSVNLNGTGLTNLTGGLAAGGDVQSFSISADSSTVVFLADKTVNDRTELYSVAIGGGAVTTLNSAPVVGGNVTNYAISANSSKVVFIADKDVDEDFELYSVNMNGTGETQLNPAIVANGDVQSFSISADSAKVVYRADQDVDEEVELYSVNIDSTGLTQVNGALIANGDVQDFKISPNSSKIVYIADQDVDEDFELYSANMDGTAMTQINGAMTANGDVISFLISNDSTQVIYLADELIDGANEIFSSAIGGGGSTRLNSPLGAAQDVTSYRISNNSSKVVYISDESTTGIFEARSVNLNATGNTNISGALVVGGDVTSFEITDDSSKVVFLADKTTNFVDELYSVAITGGAVTKVSSDVVTGGNAQSNFVLTPDSSKAIYRSDTFTDEVFELFIHNH